MNQNIVVGLDIGTTKICSVIAQITNDNEMDIKGKGIVPSRGLRRGVVVNIENTASSIAQAIQEAEIQAGMEIDGAYIGISGGHIEGITSKGVIAIDRNKEISEEEIRRAISAARAITIPVDREILHILPQEYIVDNQDGIKDPTGMSGSRLEVIVHIITAAATSLNNILKSVNKAGVDVKDIVLEPLASSQAVLTEEEKELGVALVDIGGGTTDFVIYSEGSLRHTGVLNIGGNHITNDIAVCLKTPTASAEAIKIQHGAAVANFIDATEELEIPGLGGRSPSIEKRVNLVSIMQPRIEEILALIDSEIIKTDEKDFLAGGVVLTGGVSLTPYIVDLAGEVFNLPVRIGRPLGIKGLTDIVDDPKFSTAVGLTMYAQDNKPQLVPTETNDKDKNTKPIMKRMKEWFKEFF